MNDSSKVVGEIKRRATQKAELAAPILEHLFNFGTLKSEDDDHDDHGYHLLRHHTPVIVFLMMSKSINLVYFWIEHTAHAADGIAHNILPIFSILSVFPKGKVIKMIKAITFCDTTPRPPSPPLARPMG